MRHVSISFKDLIEPSVNASKKINPNPSTPEKLLFSSNRQLKPKVLYFSINTLLKENHTPKFNSFLSTHRRQKLKQLSSNFKLKRESLSYVSLS